MISTSSSPYNLRRRWRATPAATFLTAIAIVLAIVAPLAYLMAWWAAPVSSRDIGVVEATRFNEGVLFDTTTVETSGGTFLVGGLFQTRKGAKVRLDTERSGRVLLCGEPPARCRPLSN